MKFRILTTSGGEVVFAGHSRQARPVYYGGPPPETGLWRLSTPKFEDFLAGELESYSFGESVETLVFGFELAELDEWGKWFKATRNYMSYRPKSKTYITVGQLEWRQVKDLSAARQLSLLDTALISAVERISLAKRKPRDFDHAALLKAIRQAVAKCKLSTVRAET